MNKEEFNELVQLYLADELPDDRKTELENLKESNPEFRKEFNEFKKLFFTIGENKPSEYSDDLLVQSRQELMRSIRKEKMKPSFFERIIERFTVVSVSGIKFAAGTSAALLAGVLLGYIIFRPTLQTTVNNSPNGVMSIDQVIASNASIENVRLLETSPIEGKITITFEAAKPYTYTGSIGDKTAQRLLANVITKSDNPGVRIRSVKTLAESADKNIKPDAEIKEALINSLKSDANAGVRRTALETLRKYPYDEEIRDAVLYTLSRDQNSGIRVAAINTLAELKLEGVKFDSTVRNELNSKVKDEQNLFIKNLAKSLLKGDDL